MKKIIYVDMDGVLVNFGDSIKQWFNNYPHLVEKYEKCPDHIPGIFRNPKPVEGSIEAIHALYYSGKYDLYIATAAPWGNPYAATDKRFWIEDWFGTLFHKRMFITHNKELLVGDYLIDDRAHNGASQFGQITNRGKLIRFGTEDFPGWNAVLKYLL